MKNNMSKVISGNSDDNNDEFPIPSPLRVCVLSLMDSKEAEQ